MKKKHLIYTILSRFHKGRSKRQFSDWIGLWKMIPLIQFSQTTFNSPHAARWRNDLFSDVYIRPA